MVKGKENLPLSVFQPGIVLRWERAWNISDLYGSLLNRFGGRVRLAGARSFMTKSGTGPLPCPSGLCASAAIVAAGPLIPPIERLKIFSPTQWEEFVLEWADALRSEYKSVERCGSAGDMGRDIVGECIGSSSEWDNYQCKHYRDSLKPTDIWVELGKLMYYTLRGDYTYPRQYFFVAPQGVGTTLSNLLKKPAMLRAKLFENWDKYCRTEILAKPVELDAALKAYINAADFSIFKAIQPLRLLDEHAKTRWYVARFGGGLPPRPQVPQPPATPAAIEANYVTELMNAYGDHLKHGVSGAQDLTSALLEHFGDSRLEFYSAEALRTFSRDTLPPGEFEKLQDEVHSGIKDETRADHADGYRRVLAVIRIARVLQLSAHSLESCLSVRDRGGICHQLANDRKVQWVKKS